jgi:hypothetical protein
MSHSVPTNTAVSAVRRLLLRLALTSALIYLLWRPAPADPKKSPELATSPRL